MGPLPDSAYMTMKLTYYDEVTPEDYEPHGFCATELTVPKLPQGTVSLNSGEVSTNFHSVKIRVKAVPRQLVISGSQQTGDQPAAVTNSLSVSESETDIARSQRAADQPSVETRGEEDVERVTQLVEESVSLLSCEGSQRDEIVCVCKNEQPDQLMLRCSVCQTSQHGACYCVIFTTDVPDKVLYL